jgi:hypothetical protein
MTCFLFVGRKKKEKRNSPEAFSQGWTSLAGCGA